MHTYTHIHIHTLRHRYLHTYILTNYLLEGGVLGVEIIFHYCGAPIIVDPFVVLGLVKGVAQGGMKSVLFSIVCSKEKDAQIQAEKNGARGAGAAVLQFFMRTYRRHVFWTCTQHSIV